MGAVTNKSLSTLWCELFASSSFFAPPSSLFAPHHQSPRLFILSPSLSLWHSKQSAIVFEHARKIPCRLFAVIAGVAGNCDTREPHMQDPLDQFEEPQDSMEDTFATLEATRLAVVELVEGIPSDDTPMSSGVPLSASSSVATGEREKWWRKVSELCQESFYRSNVALKVHRPTRIIGP